MGPIKLLYQFFIYEAYKSIDIAAASDQMHLFHAVLVFKYMA